MPAGSSEVTQFTILCNVRIPDTPTVSAVTSFIKEHLDPPTYNHVMRSLLFGFAIASKMPDQEIQNRDLEAHAVSAMMHDLAWNVQSHATESFVSKEKRFEIDSADATKRFLSSLGDEWPKPRIQLVWDAIALHATRSIARYKEPEVSCTSLGILADFIPPCTPVISENKEAYVSDEEYSNITKAFPRTGFLEYFKGTMCRLCEAKPETTYDNFVGGFGEVFVEGYSMKGKRFVDNVINQLEP